MARNRVLSFAAILLFSLTLAHLVGVLIDPPVVRADYWSSYYFGCGISPFCISDYGPCLSSEWGYCVAYACAGVEYSGACGLGAQDYCYGVCS
jgi:hypothetical protein